MKLTVAILPSPTYELKDPFSRRASDDNTAPSLQFSNSIRQTPLQITVDMPLRPIHHGNSNVSLNSSLSDDSRKRSSALASASALRDFGISSELDLQSVMRASLAIQEGPEVKNIILKLVHIIMQTAGANYGCIMLRGQRMEQKSLLIEVVGHGNKVNLVDHRPLQSQTDVVPTKLCE